MRKIKNYFVITFGSVVGIFLFIFLLPLALALMPFVFISELGFKKKYKVFLGNNEGKRFFCYTSRQKSRSIIEKEILPNIEKDINIIFLHGRNPESQFPQKYISYALYNIKNIGFPSILLIKNGEVLDVSLKKEIYNAINQDEDLSSMPSYIEEKFLELEEKYEI